MFGEFMVAFLCCWHLGSPRKIRLPALSQQIGAIFSEAQTDIVQRIYGGDTCCKKEKLNRIGICGIGTRLAGVAILKKLIFANAFTYMHIVHVLNCRDDFAVTYT